MVLRLRSWLTRWLVTLVKLFFGLLALPILLWNRRSALHFCYPAPQYPRPRAVRGHGRPQQSHSYSIRRLKSSYVRVIKQVRAFGPAVAAEPPLSPVVPISSVLSILRTPSDRFEDEDDSKASRFFTLKNGLRVHYYDKGLGPTTVVFLHGSLTWSVVWKPVLNLMASPACRVVALDLPGYGKSDKSSVAGDMSVSLFCYALYEFMASLCGAGVAVVCHGMAGFVFLRALSEYPQLQRLVNRLVLVQVVLPVYNEFTDISILAHHLFTQGWQTVIGSRLFPPASLLPPTNRHLYTTTPYPTPTYKKVFNTPFMPLPSSPEAQDAKLQLYGFSTAKRVWVIWGKRDWFCPDGLPYLTELCECPGVYLENSGHYPMQDEPEEFTDTLCEFLGIDPDVEFHSSMSVTQL